MKINFLKPTLAFALLISCSLTAMAQKKGKKIPKVLATGEVFECSIQPKVENGLQNTLRLVASKRTDLAVRLIDKKTEECIRYAFINQGEKYDITGIPYGKYYVKVGLGKDWAFTDTTVKCEGGFKETPLYKKVNNTFNFPQKKNQVNMYELDFDLITTKGKQTNEELISEKEFQK
ncbi:MAG TPA: hypothetical protein VKG26_07565 [Bacteroidia bacterium]|nr:hypothetical protein [Bacteroidia bacterium]